MSDSHTKAVYTFIHTYIQDHQGQPPTIREIGKGAYLAPSTVIRYLDKLEAWGLIEREPFLSRSIRLTDKGFPEG